MMAPTATVSRKIALMGFQCVGKSSLTLQFVEGKFPNDYNPSIEDCHEKTYNYNGKKYNLEILDTAGQQEYSLFPRSCASINIQGFILVYAINNKNSFEVVRVIHDKILDNFGDNVPLVLVGNKQDLQHTERVVSTEAGRKLAEEWNAAFLEVSARDRTLAEEVFKKILYEIEVSLGNIKREPQGNRCCIS